MKLTREIDLIVKRVESAVWSFKQESSGANAKPGKAYLLQRPFFDLLKQKIKMHIDNFNM